MLKKALIISFTAFMVFGCSERQSGHQQEPPLARVHAEQFLVHLRSQEWAQAADYVLINSQALNRFALASDTDRSEVIDLIQELFREVYGTQPPGPIVEILHDPDGSGKTDLIFVTYIHEDLDSFYMRLVDGQWLYSFE